MSTVLGQMALKTPNPPRTEVLCFGLTYEGRLSVGGLPRALGVAGAQFAV